GVDGRSGDGGVVGAHGRPAAVGTGDELDAVELVFANGATVRFRQSFISPNDVSLVASADGGWSTMGADDAAIARSAVDAVAASGIGSLDRVATRRFLAQRSTALGPFLREAREGFNGNSSTDDLEVLFQQLHLAHLDPRIDARGLAEAVERSEELQGSVATEPSRAADDAVLSTLFADDPRFSIDPPAIDDLTPTEALRLYQERFDGVDDLVIAIVGDADPDVVEDLASRYVGTLPAAPADSWRDVRPTVPLGDELIEVPVGGQEEAASVRVVFPTALPIDAETRVRLRVLETLVNSRLFLSIREELGATYGGFMSLEPSVAPVEEVRATFGAQVDPERASEVLEVVVADLDDLARNGPSDEEVARAVALTRSDYELVSNGQFLTMLLTRPEEEPLTFDRRLDLLDQVDAAALGDLAAVLFDPTRRIQVRTVPG
ncbi:MAG: insulinase family protein, partial [Actinomycetota bacterium]